VEEREAEVVVLQIQWLAQPFRDLIDKAEQAAVRTGMDAVEDGAGERYPRFVAAGIVELELEWIAVPFDSDRLPPRLEIELVVDDVMEFMAVE